MRFPKPTDVTDINPASWLPVVKRRGINPAAPVLSSGDAMSSNEEAPQQVVEEEQGVQPALPEAMLAASLSVKPLPRAKLEAAVMYGYHQAMGDSPRYALGTQVDILV